MRKIIFLFLAIFLSFYLFSSGVLASDQFETTYDVVYRVSQKGPVHVDQEISLTNLTSESFVSQYSLTLQGGQVTNLSATDDLGELETSLSRTDDLVEIKMFFNQKVAGKGKTLTFNVSFDFEDLVNYSGNIQEINIPKLTNYETIDHYQVSLLIPASFGEPNYLSPDPETKTQLEDYSFFQFKGESVAENGIHAVFGELQVFDFVLNYHLTNPGKNPTTTEIALPPDTAFQKVFYQEIEPLPIVVEADPDGNWLATYSLEPNQNLDVKIIGTAHVFSSPQADFPSPSPETLEQNLQGSKYWPVKDSLILENKKGLTSAEDIYHFVIKTLDYDYAQVESGQRKGAIEALRQPEQATCMEFTDLFVTLARAAGIPAREINGYAHTTDPKLKPLDLVTDVLHSWPEYYDQEKRLWVPIDPTWGKTTGGVDYFNKVDMNHLAFVIHGQDSEQPFPAGTYKTGGPAKDVQVIFGDYFKASPPLLTVTFEDQPRAFFEIKNSQKIKIKNPGSGAAYSLDLKLDTENLKLNSPSEIKIGTIPPYGEAEVVLNYSASTFNFGEGKLLVNLNNQTFEKKVKIRSLIVEIILPSVFLLLALTFGFLRVKKKRGLKSKR